jgi:hypothetical protein
MFSRPFRLFTIGLVYAVRVNEFAAGEVWHQWQDVSAYASTISTKAPRHLGKSLRSLRKIAYAGC